MRSRVAVHLHRLRPLGRRIVHLEHGRGQMVGRVPGDPEFVLVVFDLDPFGVEEVPAGEVYREPRGYVEQEQLAEELRVSPEALARFWEAPSAA